MKTTTTLLGIAIATGLAVPAQAQGRNPPGVNPTHYQCYKVDPSATAPVTVSLKDQFGSFAGVRVLRPILLCAPTVKNGGPISDRTTHYLCYDDEGVRPPLKRALIANQFGRITVTVATPTMLCVPSLKRLL